MRSALVRRRPSASIPLGPFGRACVPSHATKGKLLMSRTSATDVRVTLSNPSRIHDLRTHLERRGFRCHPGDTDTLEVETPRERLGTAEAEELADLLSLWIALHPGVDVSVAD